MNERIKELWEKSQQWNGSDDGRGGLKIHESVEKFAELIVEECAMIARSTKREVDVDGGAVMRKHFGVDE